MKIIFLSYSDFIGGAALAAHAIYKSIYQKKIYFLTVERKHKDTKVIYNIMNKIHIFILRILEKILIFFFSKKKYHQSLNLFNTFTYNKIKKFNPDIINLHWINRSMISLKEINKFNEKIVISFHDMWFLNSTEHYFDSKKKNDNFLSKYCWQQKRKILYKKNVYFIVHNRWMFDQIKKNHPKLKKKIYLSKYYPIDINLFKPRNKIFLRKKYNLPADKKIIFFSAQDISDPRKGFLHYKNIISKLSTNKNFHFLSLGKSKFNLNDCSNYTHIDFLSHKVSSELYSLSDIFLCTSIIDNLPLTILEALSSGNLVISFENGGAKEVLKNIGYSFKISEIKKLIKLIENISEKKLKEKSILSRKFALKNLTQNNIKKQYIKIFHKINKANIF